MSNEQREQALYHAIYIERLPNLEVEPFAKGWQAALSHQGRVVPVSVLEGLCDEWERNVGSDYFACAQDLRAIIEKGEV